MSSPGFDFEWHEAQLGMSRLADRLGRIATAEENRATAEVDVAIASANLANANPTTIEAAQGALDLYVRAHSNLFNATLAIRSAQSPH